MQVLRQLTACRTPLLGGSLFQCGDCGVTERRYHSCRNRHCPQCGGTARARWLERVSQQLLPVPFFQVVFTLPDELSELTLAHPAEVYGLLFRAAAETLLEVGADPRHLGARLGFWLVLHTWGQQLQHHPHVHSVVPGGGLSPDGSLWVSSAADYFLSVRVLSQVSRDKFLMGLRTLATAGAWHWPSSSAGVANADAAKSDALGAGLLIPPALGAGLLTPPLYATVGLPGSSETSGHRSAGSMLPLCPDLAPAPPESHPQPPPSHRATSSPRTPVPHASAGTELPDNLSTGH